MNASVPLSPSPTVRRVVTAATGRRLLLILVLVLGACAPQEPTSTDETTADTGAQEAPAAGPDDSLPVLATIDGFGYQPRACGFDLDDDGRIGEAEDDCRVCDGATADPDGDGIDENLVYVDCATGTDSDDCGTPDAPCGSLGHAWGQVAANPPAGLGESIVCFRGTCREDAPITPPTAGGDGLVEVAADGAARAFERPANPTLLAGWDSDGDGEYPPTDPDDEAVLSGTADRAIHLDARHDRVELAHFTVERIGQAVDAAGTGAKNSGVVSFGPSQGELDHVYLHDLHWIDINRGRATASEVSTVNLFAGKTRLRWLWIDNVWAPRNGGWFARGSALDQGPDAGPLRFSRSTVTAQGCDFDQCAQGAAFAGFHIWGKVRGIEIVGNHFDAGVGDWQPKPKGGPTGARFALVAQCSQDWSIRDNLVIDFKNALRVQGWAARYCDDANARPVTDIVFADNVVRNAYEPWGSGDMAIEIAEGGEDAGEVVGDVSITNNILASPVGGEACVRVIGGNGAAEPPGTVVVADNTCVLDVDYHGALTIGLTGGAAPAFPPRIEMTGNIVTGLGEGDPNIRVNYASDRHVVDGNRYDPVGDFVWLDGDALEDLDAWREASGLDGGSTACLPSFLDYEAHDYRPSTDDTCARDAAGAIVAGRRSDAP